MVMMLMMVMMRQRTEDVLFVAGENSSEIKFS